MGIGAWTKRSRDKHGSSKIVQTLDIFLPYCPSNISLWARDYIEEGNSWKGEIWVQRKITEVWGSYSPSENGGTDSWSCTLSLSLPRKGTVPSVGFQKLMSLYYSPSENRNSMIKSIVKNKQKNKNTKAKHKWNNQTSWIRVKRQGQRRILN